MVAVLSRAALNANEVAGHSGYARIAVSCEVVVAAYRASCQRAWIAGRLSRRLERGTADRLSGRLTTRLS